MTQVTTKATCDQVKAAIREGLGNQEIRRQFGWQWKETNRLREAMKPTFVGREATQVYLGSAMSATYQPRAYDGFGVITVMAVVIHAATPAEALARQICWHVAASKLIQLSRATGHDHCFSASDERYAGCCDKHEQLAAQKRSLNRFADVTAVGRVEIPAEVA
jgi:hypothetical protein